MTDPLLDILERAKTGDPRAFDSLARAHERQLYAHVVRMLGNESDAEDVVQDCLVSAWRSIGSFEGTSFRAWAFRIATNRAIDLLRARRRRNELPIDPPERDDEPVWAEPADGGPDLATLAGDREALALVELALAELPETQRAAVLLRDIEGFDYDEIARITSTQVGTVKSRIHRGRLAIRNALVTKGWKGAGG